MIEKMSRRLWVVFGVTAFITMAVILLQSGLQRVHHEVAPDALPTQPLTYNSVGEEKPARNISKPRELLVRPKRWIWSEREKKDALAYLLKYKRHFAPNFKVNKLPDPTRRKTVTEWWQGAALIDAYINSDPRYKCKKTKSFGNWAACMDEPYKIKPPCLVYSFGIAFNFKFDDAMVKLGCEVHSFDPSMNVSDHRRGPRSYFHNLGLSSFNSDGFKARFDIYVKHPQTWKMRTLRRVREMLGHSDRVIDVLKIDVEGHEWAVIDNIMETGEFSDVRQFDLEFHIFPKFPVQEDYIYMYQTYTKLREDYGFHEFSTAPHPYTMERAKYNIQGDSQFVNTHFRPVLT